MSVKNDSLFFYKKYFINSTIKQGRKLYSERMFHETLNLLKKFSHGNPNSIILQSILNLLPLIGLIPVKVGSSVYSIPVSLGIYKKRLHALKFIIKSIKTSKHNLNAYDLAEVLHGAYHGEGLAIEKKKAVYSQGIDNAPYMRFLRRRTRF